SSFFLITLSPPNSTFFPYTTLFRSFPTFRRWTRTVRWNNLDGFAYGLCIGLALGRVGCISVGEHFGSHSNWLLAVDFRGGTTREDRKSTRLNSSHLGISYAVFCLKK